MRPLLPLLLVLLAGPAAAQKSGAAIRCKEDHTACKEDCTIEFGGSSRTYNKLGTCLQKCANTFGECKERHFSLQQNDIEPSRMSSPPPPPEEPPERSSSTSTSDLDEDAAPSSTGRKGVYRASEAAPPAPAPEEEELEPLSEEAAPAPPPKPAPKRPEAPKEPPKPKKKDLSEWD
ncbi:hypothetical protein [Stigmatella erecta]|nr:hypothetical protein [Stigmatella erecta]